MQHRQTDWFSFGTLESVDATPSATEYRFSSGTVTFSQSSDRWIRVRFSLDGAHARRSWAVDPAREASRSWERLDVDSPTAFRDTRHIVFAAGNDGVEGNINPHEDTRGIKPVTVAGHRYFLPLLESVEVSRSRNGVLLSFPFDPGVRLYGLGEKTGELDKRGRTWTMWNSDEPEHLPLRDPLYQSIPVAYLFTPQSTGTLFVDSTATIHVDAGEAMPDRLQLEVHDRAFECFIRVDDTLPNAVSGYTALTGRAPLPPEWALGFQQCRYSYFPDTRVREVARTMRRHRIPCDVIYLDIHYMDGYRVFTWDRKRFPDPAALTRDLRSDGFRVVTIVDPGVKADPEYPVFADGATRDLFLKEPTGAAYRGAVWPGEAVFPDFTDSAAREWWASWHHELFDAGVDGIWNDMNEPADFTGSEEFRPDFTVPDRLMARNDGDSASMATLHNAYANGMNDATRAAFTRYRPTERGFVLTRAGYAGIQRTAAVWTGDNHSWWEHIALMQPMLMNLGVSGVAFCGGDAGGFQANASGELVARWFEAAALMPFFRAHSALDTRDHEPWSFGPTVLDAVRNAISLRYRLLPYLYTLFEEASRTGAPVMRPLVYEYPHDAAVENRADQFMVGSALLVAPVATPAVRERAVYLPAGRWYDFWSGAAIDSAGEAVLAVAPLDRIPIFVRGGSIIPHETVRQHTAEAGDETVRLLVAPAADGTARGSVYGDAGEGFAMREGEFWHAELAWDGASLRQSSPARSVHHRGPEGGDIRFTRWRQVTYARVSAVGSDASSILDLPSEGALEPGTS
jgi:alpha-glucosidase